MAKLLVVATVLARETCATTFIANGADADKDTMTKNPIRKVVGLLEGMVKKVSQEGDREEELYKKFKCYCKSGGGDLQESINGNNAKVPQVQSDIEASEATVAQLKEDLKAHTLSRNAAKQAMGEATALREKDHTKFMAESTELQGYVGALSKAVPAIANGMAGTALVQSSTAAAAVLRKATGEDSMITEDDRATVLAFLSGGGVTAEGSAYTPAGGEVLGIMKTMLGDFEKDLAAVTGAETEAVSLHDDLIASKTKEVKSLGASIEKKTARAGELAVNIVHMKQDLTESEAALIEDQDFLANLDKDCATKLAEFDERVKIRSEELEAIHSTIKILNDDDALELFKKALPGAGSLLQFGASGKDGRRLAALQIARKIGASPSSKDRPEVRFLEIALAGGKVDFTKVIKMVDDMVKLLAQEQADDDTKSEYCQKQIDTTEDKVKMTEKSIDDLEVAIEDKTEAIGTFTEEIKTMKSEIVELDKLVAEASTQRKSENEEYTQSTSDNSAAKELLEFAKNRLQKFYNPSLYKGPPKADGSDEDSFVQLQSRRSSDKPGPAPETPDGEYKKSGEASSGVINMIDLLVRDLTKEMTVAEADEENSQKDYEGFMQESAGKRAKLVKAINIKEESKAGSEISRTQQEGTKKVTQDELQGSKMYAMQLHSECDWLMQNFDLRKQARADERDNLKQAKAILSGADFSLVQVAPKNSRKPFLGTHRAF